jgi:hypothetical protein
MFSLVRCQTKGGPTKFKEGDFSVLADTNNLGFIQGPANFYDKNNTLAKRIFYKDGIRNGPAVHFYGNGIARDSVVYTNGKKNSYWYHFDSTGKLRSREMYFFDKRLGPEEYYGQNGNIRFYYFTDFERRDIAFAKYDAEGKLYDNDLFRLQFIAKTSDYDSQMVHIFSYLPRLPACEISYHIGVTNDKKETQELFEVKNELFIDTLLPKLDSNTTYYISCSIVQQKSKFNRVYIEEYGKRAK